MTRMVRALTLALMVIFVAGCSIIKASRVAHGGRVSRRSFKIEVPFEMRLGLMVVRVHIHGHEYSFILDTGAPNVISKELAEKLGIHPKGSGKAGDSQGNSSHLDFAVIDSMGIGDLQFLHTGTAIADLHHSTEIACFKVDGLLGANLMRKAIWQIDYERQVITITSSRDSLSVPANSTDVHFETTLSGTPLIDMQLNNFTAHKIIVDLGSNGDFCSSYVTFDALRENGLRDSIFSYGAGTSSGLYGRDENDTIRYAVVPGIRFGGVQLSNQVVSFSKKGATTIGTNFFKHYRLIFDWSQHVLTMIPVSAYDNTRQKLYYFTFVLRDHRVFIGTMYTAGGAPSGPQLGDQVLEADGIDVRNCSGDTWCALLSQRYNSEAPTTLLLKRGNREWKVTVSKEALFAIN